MKRNKHKIAIAGLALLSLSSLTVLNSCSHPDDIIITDPRSFTAEDIKSYEDLFEVFWITMDQQYNYFYEQKQVWGMDWDQVYSIYKPKFAALKTYGRPGEDYARIQEDYLAAYDYFEEIINPIFDQNFKVTIQFPIDNSGSVEDVSFYRGMSDEVTTAFYSFGERYSYMERKVDQNALKSNSRFYAYIAGKLEANPDIYYLSFGHFSSESQIKITLEDKFTKPDPSNPLVLTEEKIKNNATLKKIQDQQVRSGLEAISINIFREYNNFPESDIFKTYLEAAANFNRTEIVSDELITIAENFSQEYDNLTDYFRLNSYEPYYNDATIAYIDEFIELMWTHEQEVLRLNDYDIGAYELISKSEFYQKILNPLHKGEIKKVIIDLRSKWNTGETNVQDIRFFWERFVTKNEVYAFQRTKEGNGRFNYTPWVPVNTNPHPFGIPADIPITILTNKATESNAEIITLILKSQGNHVISVGDYTFGATAGLGPSDDFNGGFIEYVAGGKLRFYMPLMATKDAKGVMIEGVGIEPDIFVKSITKEEIKHINSPDFEDKALNEAIKYLQSK